ncbi:MAG: histidine--tRNA ligase, partial [Thermoproteus sp.]|nr:histidine--tRNA ligase [Thermoproteus sp.]
MPGLEDAFRRPVRGMRDLTPELFYALKRVEETLSRLAEGFGYRRVEMPAVEHFEVLARKAGREIVDEIYYFRDKAGRELGLRFDMTVPIARALSYRLDEPKPVRWYYFTKVWRYDEPQHGRYREFYQFGIELIGSSSPRADAEVLALMAKSVEAVGIRDYVVRVNDRNAMEKILANLGAKSADEVYRVLDKRGKIPDEEIASMLLSAGLTKEQADSLLSLASEQRPLADAPELLSKYDLGLAERYRGLAKSLDAFDLLDRFVFDLSIVRGLDYYTGLVFEAFAGKYKLAVGGGGRYDNLIELYSGVKTPALGFAIGVERLMEAAGLERADYPLEYYVYPIGEEAYETAVEVAEALRNKGASVVVDLGEWSLREALERSAKGGVRYFVIVGKKELER